MKPNKETMKAIKDSFEHPERGVRCQVIDFDKLFEIDPSIPIKRGQWCELYTTYGGGVLSVHRYWHHALFKRGKPQRMRKAR